MKIDGFGSITSTNNTGKRRDVSSAGNFADLLAAAESGEAPAAAATSDITATSALNFLALQEIPDEYIARKKLVQKGNAMLDTLEKLRRQLLSGPLSPHLLLDMEQQLIQQRQVVDDPKLHAIIDDIELRAAVELAKLQMATKVPSPLEGEG